MFIDFREGRREWKRERERERERNVDMREKHWLVASRLCPKWASNQQTRYVPWLGVQPSASWCMGWHSKQLSHLARQNMVFWNNIIYYLTDSVDQERLRWVFWLWGFHKSAAISSLDWERSTLSSPTRFLATFKVPCWLLDSVFGFS